MTAIQPSIHCLPPQVARTGVARRRRSPVPVAPSQASLGAAQLAPAATLPFAARVGVHVQGRLLYPILGAILGTLLLGIPGTFIGAGVGLLLA
jgi:hypothetical protein